MFQAARCHTLTMAMAMAASAPAKDTKYSPEPSTESVVDDR
jgi:hypothetical protein